MVAPLHSRLTDKLWYDFPSTRHVYQNCTVCHSTSSKAGAIQATNERRVVSVLRQASKENGTGHPSRKHAMVARRQQGVNELLLQSNILQRGLHNRSMLLIQRCLPNILLSRGSRPATSGAARKRRGSGNGVTGEVGHVDLGEGFGWGVRHEHCKGIGGYAGGARTYPGRGKPA